MVQFKLQRTISLFLKLKRLHRKTDQFIKIHLGGHLKCQL